MSLLRPTRRELISAAPLLVGASVLPAPLLAGLPTQTLKFLVVGDWGRDGKHSQRDVAQQMGRTATSIGSRFTVSTGDNFYLLGVSSTTDRQWETSFERIYTAESLQTPWYAVLGNHDYGGRVQAQIDRTGEDRRWRMPARWHDLKVDEADAHLFFIDTVAWLGKESFPFKWLGSDIRPEHQEEQIDWLVTGLRNSTARTKLVFGHHGIYSIGPHGGKMRMKELDDVLRRFGVTAYVNGHDHCLYHISRNGMDYICSGAGSEVKRTYTGVPDSQCVVRTFCDPSTTDSVFPYWHSYRPEAGFAAFEVGPSGVDLRFIDINGGVTHQRKL